MLDCYKNINFVLDDGGFDLTTCPVRNTEILKKYGLKKGNKNQLLDGNSKIFSSEYFCPKDYYTSEMHITDNTYSIHHYSASWTSAAAKRTLFVKRIIGVKLYNKLYGKFLHKFKWLEW